MISALNISGMNGYWPNQRWSKILIIQATVKKWTDQNNIVCEKMVLKMTKARHSSIQIKLTHFLSVHNCMHTKCQNIKPICHVIFAKDPDAISMTQFPVCFRTEQFPITFIIQN